MFFYKKSAPIWGAFLIIMKGVCTLINALKKIFSRDKNFALPKVPEVLEAPSSVILYKESIKHYGNGIEVSFYIKNTLEKKVNLKIMPLILKNSQGEVLAAQTFDLSDLGSIEPLTKKLCKVIFIQENIYADQYELEEYDPVFYFGKIPNIDRWVEINKIDIPQEFQAKQAYVYGFMRTLEVIRENDFSFSTYMIDKKEANKFRAVMLLRNGTLSERKLEEIKLSLYHKNIKLVSKTFCEDNLNVAPLGATLHIFEFGSVKELDIDFDIENCGIRIE